MQLELSKFGTNFSSREKAHALFDDIESQETLVLDFNGVDEVTPSFCHELLDIFVNKKNLKIQILNANDSIKFQFNKALTVFKKSQVVI